MFFDQFYIAKGFLIRGHWD